jgi:hypothetical protein
MPRLLSARESFLERTIAHIPGTFGKICFLSEICSISRDYEHWGLARTFGKGVARAAISEAHTEFFLQELATPLRVLWSELQSKSLEAGTGLQENSGMLEQVSARLPIELAGGSEQHHRYIFMALSLLTRNQHSTRPGA